MTEPLDPGKGRIEFAAPLPGQPSGHPQLHSDEQRILLTIHAACTSTCCAGSNVLTPRRRYEPVEQYPSSAPLGCRSRKPSGRRPASR